MEDDQRRLSEGVGRAIAHHALPNCPATLMTLARQAAIKAVKRDIQARGERIANIEWPVITSAAIIYLQEHPELIEEAAETVRKVPQLRTLGEREERQRRKNAR